MKSILQCKYFELIYVILLLTSNAHFSNQIQILKNFNKFVMNAFISYDYWILSVFDELFIGWYFTYDLKLLINKWWMIKWVSCADS